MQINSKILSIPPFISTAWNHVTSLYVAEKKGKQALMVALLNGTVVEIPDLDNDTINAAFRAHAEHLKMATAQNRPSPLGMSESTIGLQIPLNMGDHLA